MRKLGVRDVLSDDWRRSGYWFSVVAAAAIAGFVLGWCWRDRPGTMSNVRILDVMTAAGTVGAVLVALWTARWQAHIIRKKEYEQAILVIVEAYPKFFTLLSTCQLVHQYFSEVERIDKSPKEMAELIEVLQSQTISAKLPRSSSIQPLEIRLVEQLAVVNSQLEALQIIRQGNWETREKRIETARMIVNGMDEAIPGLRKLGETGLAWLNKSSRQEEKND